MADEREALLIRGTLDRAGRFTPGRSRSTTNVREWPVVESSDVVAELLDADGEILHRELAEVRPNIDCAPGDARQFRLQVYIELREDATAVQLRRGDLVLWRSDIAGPARLKVKLGRRRKDKIVVRSTFSEAGDNANMLVVYQWGEGRFQPVYAGPPQETLEIDLAEMPGGEDCRFAVTYSNGMRSASAATDTFAVARRGPSVTIVRPEKNAKIVAGTPVILEGGVLDRERRGGPRLSEDVVWLVDGAEAGRGLIASVDGLTEGAHEIELVYNADPGASARVEVTARASRAAPADTWGDWDPLSV
jgi:hypothetical protein